MLDQLILFAASLLANTMSAFAGGAKKSFPRHPTPLIVILREGGGSISPHLRINYPAARMPALLYYSS
jgi:hypothetical protein